MDDWRQRAKTLLDQIYAVDPYYVQSNECKPIGQISYADITAGRTSPSSRDSSPFGNSRDEAASSSPPLAVQPVKPFVREPIGQRARDTSATRVARPEATIEEEQTKNEATSARKEPEPRAQTRRVSKLDMLDAAPKHRPNSRRAASARKDPSESADRLVKNASSADKANVPESPRFTERNKEPMALKHTLALREERRGRSASPIWMPGFASYADILRGQGNASRSPSVEATKNANSVNKHAAIDASYTEMEKVELGVSRVRFEEKKKEEENEEERKVVTEKEKEEEEEEAEVVVEEEKEEEQRKEDAEVGEIPAEQSRQRPTIENYRREPDILSAGTVKPNEETPETDTRWADEPMEDYDALNAQSYENVAGPRQIPEVYNYIHPPMPELVGFIGSQIAYPVSSYVYVPTAPSQRIALPSYDGRIAFPSEQYVGQPAYLPETEVYRQNQIQKQPQRQHHHPELNNHASNPSVAMQHAENKRVSSHVSATANVQPVVQPDQVAPLEKPVNSELPQPASTSEPSTTTPKLHAESKTFSYAQILSQGLNPRATSTTSSSSVYSSATEPTATPTLKQSKERAGSPSKTTTFSARETTPLMSREATRTRESSEAKQEIKQEEATWDTARKRETRKTQQETQKSKPAEKKARKEVEQPKEKPRKEKAGLLQSKVDEAKKEISTVKSTTSANSKSKDITETRKETKADVPKDKQTDSRQEKTADAPQGNGSQERKRKTKKKKTDKPLEDEIEKALKEIEDMEKQKSKNHRDKSREQTNSKDVARAIPEKAKEENEKKNERKSSEKQKQSKPKAETKAKDTSSLVETPESRSSVKEHVKSEDDARERKDDSDLCKKSDKDVDKIDVKETESNIEHEKIDSKKFERNVGSTSETQSEKLDTNEEKSPKEFGSKKKQKGKEQRNAAKEKSSKDTVKPTETEETKKSASIDDATKLEIPKENDNKAKKRETESPKEATEFEPKLEAKDKPRSKGKIVDAKTTEPTKSKENVKGKCKKMKQRVTEQDDSKAIQSSKKSSQQEDIGEVTVVRSTEESKVKLETTKEDESAIKTNEIVDIEKLDEPVKSETPTRDTSTGKKESNDSRVSSRNDLSEATDTARAKVTDEASTGDPVEQNDRSIVSKGKLKNEREAIRNKERTNGNIADVSNKIDVQVKSKETPGETVPDVKPTENITEYIRESTEKEISLSGFRSPSNAETNSKNKVSGKESEEDPVEYRDSEQKDRIPEGTSDKKKKPSKFKSKEKIVTENISSPYVVESKEESKTSQSSIAQKPEKKKKKKLEKKVTDSSAPSSPLATDKPDVSLMELNENCNAMIVTKVSETGIDTEKIPTNTDEFAVNENEEQTRKLPVSEDKNKNPSTETKNDSIKKKSKRPRTANNKSNESASNVTSEEIPKKEEVAGLNISDLNSSTPTSTTESSMTTTGKALIIEKMVTTVTTTTSIPGSVEVKPPNVKSVKSVEILESIPLPKIVGSKPTELITLRPETVEASLTTRYARISDDSAVGIPPKGSLDALADYSEKFHSDYAVYIDSLVDDDQPVLFGSVQDRRRDRSGTPLSPKSLESSKDKRELDGVAKEQQPDLKSSEINVKVVDGRKLFKEEIIVADREEDDIEVTTQAERSDDIVESKEMVTSISAGENFIVEGSQENGKNVDTIMVASSPVVKGVVRKEEEDTFNVGNEPRASTKNVADSKYEEKDTTTYYYEDLVKPYWLNYHSYVEAESDFHRRFKVVELVQENLPASTSPISTSIENIVQESIMKRPDREKEIEEESKLSEADRRKHALVAESTKYPVSMFCELESEWVKSKLIEERKLATSAFSEEAEKCDVPVEEKTVQMHQDEKQRTESETPDKSDGVIDVTEAARKSSEIIDDEEIVDIARKSIGKKESPEKITDDKTGRDLNIAIGEDVTAGEFPSNVVNEEEKTGSEEMKVTDTVAVETQPEGTNVETEKITSKTEQGIQILTEEKVPEEKLVDETVSNKEKISGTSEEEGIVKEKSIKEASQSVTEQRIAAEKPVDTIVSKEDEKKTIRRVSESKDSEMKEEEMNLEEPIKFALGKSAVVNEGKSTTETLLDGKISESIVTEEEKGKIVDSETKEDTPPKEDTKTSTKSKKRKHAAKDKATAVDKEATKQTDKMEAGSPLSKKKRDGKSKKGNEVAAPMSFELAGLNEQMSEVNVERETVTKVSEVKNRIEKNETEMKDIPEEDVQSPAFVVDAKEATETIASISTENVQGVTVIDAVRESPNETPRDEKIIERIEKSTLDQSQSPSTKQKPTKRQKKKDLKVEKSGSEIKTSCIESKSEKKQVKIITEKIEHLSEGATNECNDNNKSYAQITAFDPETSLQAIEDTIPIGPVSLELDKNFDKMPETEEPLLKVETIELAVETDSARVESSSWVEEIEKEAREEIDSITSSLNKAAGETFRKEKDSWASIVGKHVGETESSVTSNIEQTAIKKEQNSQLRSLPRVQIHVEEAPEPVPIENVVQVDDQGFMEFVNRRELRSRRSRSRSRSARRNETPSSPSTKQSKNKGKSKTDNTDTSQETKKYIETPVSKTHETEEKIKSKEAEETQPTVKSEDSEVAVQNKIKTSEQPKSETREQPLKSAPKKSKRSKKGKSGKEQPVEESENKEQTKGASVVETMSTENAESAKEKKDTSMDQKAEESKSTEKYRQQRKIR
ncbi:microtubule-associated protein futsch-like [Hylaeus volcanicus]|uniref:microtubule-associated protein futsch-like n=1 Tax=Hylaeus volcanicus TaxID=313075 RepID=UPI0023B7D1EE|nr:microtubule-associated protein futsch-like [Hylaeus volcanicus]